MTKAMRKTKYFIGIEARNKKHELFHSQKSMCQIYYQLLVCKPVSTSIESDVNFWNENSVVYKDNKQYMRMNRKLIYLTVTMSSYVIGLLSQFMHKLRDFHQKAALRVLVDTRSSFGKRLFYKKHEHIYIFVYSDAGYIEDKDNRKLITSHFTLVGSNLVN